MDTNITADQYSRIGVINLEALFHPPGAMGSLLKGDAPAILQKLHKSLGTAMYLKHTKPSQNY